MKFTLVAICLTFISPGLFGQKGEKSHGQHLFNGKDLMGWETYLDRPDQSDKKQEPIGLNSDPNHVFSVVEEDGKPAIRISGEIFGGITTLEEFENYHLSLEFKWGKQKWPPKLNQPMDSGLLYHSVGNYGSSFLWLESFEFQIQEGDCGDYWGVSEVLADISAEKNEKGKYVYRPGKAPVIFKDKTPVGRTCLKSGDYELKTGEWNTVDLYCLGGTAVHMINGKVNMVLENTRHIVNGQELPLTKGKIQFQSEGAEIFYRNMKVESIKSLPAGLAHNYLK